MHKKTVFVIGAGASEEAKLPTGTDLKIIISELLNIQFEFGFRQISGDRAIYDALDKHIKESGLQEYYLDQYVKEAWHIRDALPQALSIDNFIDSHKDNEKIALCGKLAIVKSILTAERKSLFHFDGQQRDLNSYYKSLEETWYIPFFQLLTENCSINNLKERFQSITLIIFNYDRCVEHFMCDALQNYYRISQDEAAALVKCINIYHPYGCVGSLPWNGHDDSMEFGAAPSATKLLQLVQKIKTFTEGTDPKSSEISAIKQKMSLAHRLIFLGFAFHKLNMQLLEPENHKNIDTTQWKFYATTYGISESDKEVISEQISVLYKVKMNTKMANLTCKDFFTEFWRSLAF